MACMRCVREHGPVGAYLAAGFVRNRVWDSLYDRVSVQTTSDIDVVYFDASDTSTETEEAFEAKLAAVMPDEIWQVRNQARMHTYAGHAPFKDVSHALEHWAETATAVGVRLDDADKLDVVAPFSLEDLLQHRLRITPIVAQHDCGAFHQRVEKKHWRERWPSVEVIGTT